MVFESNGDQLAPSNTPRYGWRAAFAIDLRSLALVRIGLGLLIVIDLCVRWPDLIAHYSDDGVLPRALLNSYLDARPGAWSLHLISGSAEVMAALFAVAAVVATAFALGYRSRLTGFLSLLLLCSLQMRNPFVLSGGDSLLRMLMFWMLFLPSGARFSIDAVRARRAGQPSLPRKPYLSISTAALLLQMAFVYWFSAILKDHPSWRSEGDALFLALSIDQFTTPFGRSILTWPPALLKAFTLATFWLEVLGPVAALFTIWGGRLRMLTIAAFIGFHLIALNLTLNLGLFPWICAVGWLAFLPPAFWERTLPRLRRRLQNWAPVRFWRPIHPPRTAATSTGAPWLLAHPASNFIAALLLLYVTCWNIRTTDFEHHVQWFPRKVNPVAQVLRIEQYWSMFAPYPMHDDGWYVVRAARADGSDIDLLTGRIITWEKPGSVAATYPNQRWRKYCMNLRRDRYRDYRGGYVRYLIRRYERQASGAAAVDLQAPPALLAVELIYMREDTLPEHLAEAPARPQVMFQTARPGVHMQSASADYSSHAEVPEGDANTGDAGMKSQ